MTSAQKSTETYSSGPHSPPRYALHKFGSRQPVPRLSANPVLDCRMALGHFATLEYVGTLASGNVIVFL